MLRIVNPAVIDVVTKPDKSGWKVSPDQNRMVINITTALQNMANGVSGTGKEAFLKPLMEALQSRAKAMDHWFDTVAEDGVALVDALSADRAGEGEDVSSSKTEDRGNDPADPKNKGKAKIS